MPGLLFCFFARKWLLFGDSGNRQVSLTPRPPFLHLGDESETAPLVACRMNSFATGANFCQEMVVDQSKALGLPHHSC